MWSHSVWSAAGHCQYQETGRHSINCSSMSRDLTLRAGRSFLPRSKASRSRLTCQIPRQITRNKRPPLCALRPMALTFQRERSLASRPCALCLHFSNTRSFKVQTDTESEGISTLKTDLSPWTRQYRSRVDIEGSCVHHMLLAIVDLRWSTTTFLRQGHPISHVAELRMTPAGLQVQFTMSYQLSG